MTKCTNIEILIKHNKFKMADYCCHNGWALYPQADVVASFRDVLFNLKRLSW